MRLCESFHQRKNSLFTGNPRGGRTAAISGQLHKYRQAPRCRPTLYRTQSGGQPAPSLKSLPGFTMSGDFVVFYEQTIPRRM
jgi:hypothetical protein